jgi:hypothetical protein
MPAMKTFARALTLMLLAGAAHAQNKLLNSKISYFTQKAGGRIAMCGIEIRLLFVDDSYKQGAVAAVTGSASWVEDRGNVGVLLKVKAIDFDAAKRPHLSQIASAFLAIKGLAATSAPFECENKLGFCGRYWLPASVFLYGALSTGNLSIGFNRQPGGFDLVFPIKSAIAETRDKAGFIAFHKCINALTERAAIKPP